MVRRTAHIYTRVHTDMGGIEVVCAGLAQARPIRYDDVSTSRAYYVCAYCMCVYDSHVCCPSVSYYVCPLCSRQVSTLQDSKQSDSPKFSSFHGSQRASTYFWSAPDGPPPSSELMINSRRNSQKIPAEMVNRMFDFRNWSCPTLSLIASMVTGVLRLRPVPQYCVCRVVCCPPFLHNIFICVVDVRGHFAGCHGDQAQVPLHWLWLLPLHLWLG